MLFRSYFYHKNSSFSFQSGRASLNFILKNIKPNKIFIPFYTCNALIEPIEENGINYEFYPLNNKLEPIEIPELCPNEYFLIINYFDTLREYIKKISIKLGDKLIIDNSQAYFCKDIINSWSFNSVRKFFGVPDGSFLYIPKSVENNIDLSLITENENINIVHLLSKFLDKDQLGYQQFQEYEKKIDSNILIMSKLTKYLLSNIDYNSIIDTRRNNFSFLHTYLKDLNILDFNFISDNNVPLYYPFYPKKKITHNLFWNEKIFVPILWNDCFERKDIGFKFEKECSSNLLPIPIDQRYNIDDMENIIKIIQAN